MVEGDALGERERDGGHEAFEAEHEALAEEHEALEEEHYMSP